MSSFDSDTANARKLWDALGTGHRQITSTNQSNFFHSTTHKLDYSTRAAIRRRCDPKKWRSREICDYHVVASLREAISRYRRGLLPYSRTLPGTVRRDGVRRHAVQVFVFIRGRVSYSAIPEELPQLLK